MAVSNLEGENKYSTADYGDQEAIMRTSIIAFPPILHLQLKRFTYDVLKDGMVKVNTLSI